MTPWRLLSKLKSNHTSGRQAGACRPDTDIGLSWPDARSNVLTRHWAGFLLKD